MSFKFLTESFINPDTNLISLTASSADPDFPAANVIDAQRRSRKHRTAGHFFVELGVNDQIRFNEGAGNLTAVIAAGSFASISLFSAGVKAAIDAVKVSAATYTVTQTSDFRFTITSDGGGGATLDLIWTDAGSTAADTLGYNTAADDTGALSYEADVARIHTKETWLFDMGINAKDDLTDFAFIGPDRNSPIKISPNASIKVRLSPTSNMTTAPVTYTITYDPEAMFQRSDTGLPAVAGARFAELEIIDRENPQGFLEIGAIYLGSNMFSDFAKVENAADFPLKIEPIDTSDVEFSEAFAHFSDEKPKSKRYSVSFKNFKRAEYERMLDRIEEFGISTPFFLHVDPNAVIGTRSNRNLIYCLFTSPPKLSVDRPRYVTGDFVVQEAL